MSIQNNGPRKRLLALDTATAVLGVAITENGQLLHETNATGERNHSVHLLPIIERALEESGTASGMLEGVVVGVGPGSYTGTRIAVTAAKTLAWAWKVPLTGVSSLHALAWGGHEAGLLQRSGEAEAASSGMDWIVPLLDARRGQAFTALFAADGEQPPQRLEPDGIRLMADWVQELEARLQDAAAEGTQPRTIWFIGETGLHGNAAALGLLPEKVQVQVVPYELEGRWVGYLGEHGPYSEVEQVHGLIPNYTQLTEAEVNLRRGSEGSLKKQ
ncbi:tRNA (adenosine(37)-N6)-threonylcarbamoyltransferase complex dimerization subunit type 1 TsaB [Paenibacillus tepidiphilus]|uniref:tRNA (adenosine(37)-N6)-threonylcarbamoyltransferase complex dimerization subunit type 1 TsaB n=1 Tax=Paenibacillus tepidiphilus TaxID=2608683 RepID=UPI0012388F8B|nr:tRNA (adenosine(37)-N6)-threonylcarbamoyltransferase complex dimerization subunit type 1 TsaB [Paenibacillus tepidiphilus]